MPGGQQLSDRKSGEGHGQEVTWSTAPNEGRSQKRKRGRGTRTAAEHQVHQAPGTIRLACSGASKGASVAKVEQVKSWKR